MMGGSVFVTTSHLEVKVLGSSLQLGVVSWLAGGDDLLVRRTLAAEVHLFPSTQHVFSLVSSVSRARSAVFAGFTA